MINYSSRLLITRQLLKIRGMLLLKILELPACPRVHLNIRNILIKHNHLLIGLQGMQQQQEAVNNLTLK